uniref:GTP-binding protein REM 1 n=1 Tax=Ceratitis capitata TaxID=7213 RepID=W8C1L6_CERCA
MEKPNDYHRQRQPTKYEGLAHSSHPQQSTFHGIDEDATSMGILTQRSIQSAILQKATKMSSPSPLPLHKSPKSPRCLPVKIVNSYEATRQSPQSPAARNSYRAQSSEPYIMVGRSGNISSLNENPPRSPKITTTYANDSCDDTSSTASYYQTPTSGSRSPRGISSHENSMDSPSSGAFLSGPGTSSPRRSPNSPRKFVFEAISPMLDSSYKKFEYYEPISPEEEFSNQSYKVNSNEYFGAPPQVPASPKMFEPRRKNSKKLLRSTPLDNNEEIKPLEWEMSQIDERCLNSQNYYIKRDSCVTESTQLSLESNDTTNSTIATATTSFSERSKTDESSSKTVPCETRPLDQRGRSRHRRHAINITSNPCYQVLHSSHSTLDRTCSDSAASLQLRKSTSDLTKGSDAILKHKTLEDSISTGYKPRRRGSSKGGLAYLASRRSSRDSMKSVCSNASIFSNDDIGPLAFQASNRGRQRRTSNFLELPVPDHIRPRVCSLPERPYNPRASDDLYRLRHFSISKGNVVNCGDSIISRRSRSNTSVNSTNSRASERSPFEGSCCGGGYANVDSVPTSPDSEDLEPPPPPRYRIVMLGDSGVGKTALVNQFMTSEYMHTYDASLDDEFGEKTVSVLLDDEESELVFIDHPRVEMSVENSLSTYEPHGCVVVFSVVEKSSFRVAEEIIKYLWQENYIKDKAVILVGNKADLARARVITTQEGKALAASHDAKFIETSSGIQHNVDELLVGILKQMRLKETREKKATSTKLKPSRTHISLHLAKEILQKICLSDISKSKSCENLHVL